MTKVIARVHSVHVMNVEQHQAAADPQTKPRDLGCESACRLLSSTITKKSKCLYRLPIGNGVAAHFPYSPDGATIRC